MKKIRYEDVKKEIYLSFKKINSIAFQNCIFPKVDDDSVSGRISKQRKFTIH